ncbi:MAG TPA: hypothetical protein VIN11_01025 [Roseivirga sp.]
MKNRSIVMGVAVAILALLTFTHEVHAQNEKTSTSISVSRGVHTISHSNAQGRLNLEYEGKIEFSDDDKSIKSISRGGYLLIRKTTFGDRREVLAEPNSDGTINYEYRVGRSRKDWGKEGQDFLANVLIEVIRTTGMGADGRVDRFYKKGGVDAVLNEVAEISSDHVSRIYLDALMANHNLNEKQLVSVAGFITRTLGSDFYISELFKEHGDKFMKSTEATDAFLSAIDRMDSDHYISMILQRALREDLSEQSLAKVLKAATRMDSDHYKTQVLKELLDRRDLDDKTIDQIVLSAADIDSDHYATIILKDALDRPNLSDAAFNNLMNAVSQVDSDHYVTETFRSMLRNRDVTDKVVEAIMNRIEYMDSDHYRTLILNDLFENQKISEKYFESLLKTVTDMDSDHYASQVLSRLLKDQQLSDAMYSKVLAKVGDIDSDHYKVTIMKDVMRGKLTKPHVMELLKAADNIDSDYYKSEVLKGACSIVREINDEQVKDEYRSVARGIRSDTYYGRVARCID